ncbi:MAG: SHOCT domain-containing protein [Micrococcaceae bacterium]|nr:SHOCT domain-containing protein [Micrococcaceae bacterium]
MDEFNPFREDPEFTDFGMIGQETSFGGGVFGAMPVFMLVFAVLFVAAVGFIIVVGVRNYNASKRAGFDPFTLQTELATRAAKSRLLAPQQSREQRLAELSDLLARQVITREEYDKARLKILTE